MPAFADDDVREYLTDWLQTQEPADRPADLIMDELKAQGFPQHRIRRFFGALEDERLGEYRIGRKGHKSRFIWAHRSATELNRLLTDGSLGRRSAAAETAPASDRWMSDGDAAIQGGIRDAETRGQAGPGLRTDGDGLLQHRLWLRRDRVIEISLPADLTQAEAERLARFVSLLPLPGAEPARTGDGGSAE